MARVVAQKLNERLGQQVVFDNRAGANGFVCLHALMQAPADGYTLALAAAGTMAVNPSLYDQLPYDPLKDFSPITNMVNFPLWLVSHPAVPAKTTLELIRQVKSDQLKKIAMGSAKRVPYLADIPTISESGLPGCEAYSWVAILAPTKTPRDIVMRLNRKWRTS